MSTRSDILRPNGFIKVDIIHQGVADIRQNLKTALLGSTGEQTRFVVEVRELAAHISQPCLSTGDHEVFFRVLGRHGDTDIRLPNGTVNLEELHLGERIRATNANPNLATENNGGVIKVPQDEFTMYVPECYCLQDLLNSMQRKFRRISSVLNRVGWLENLGGLDDARDGTIPGGVGQAGYTQNPPMLPIDEQDDEDLLVSFNFYPGGYCELQGRGEFFNSFVIWVSPLLREITGWPELYCYTNGVFGEEDATQNVAGDIEIGEFADSNMGDNDRFGHISTKSLFSTFEERRDVLVSSDIPIPIERFVKEGEDKHRFIFGQFDIRGKHDLQSARDVRNWNMRNGWQLSGVNVIGRQIMDPPSNTGFTSLVLPSQVNSFNIRVMLRRKQWNFTTNKYEDVQVPLMKYPTDTLVLRLLFTAQT